jgi:small ligand-binding sensory domain FIST
MIRAGTGQSSSDATEQAVVQAASDAMAQAGITRADAAFVFFTVEHVTNHGQLAETLRKTIGTDRVVGSTAAGILTETGEIEGSPGVAVLVFAADEIQSEPFLFQPLRERDEEIGVQIAQLAHRPAEENRLLVMTPDTYNGQPQALLNSLHKQIGFVPVIGAGSSENGSASATYQLCGDDLATNAVAGMSLSGAFDARIDITQGCQPITEPMVITKAQKNLIIEINERPAIEAFARILKGPLAEDLRRALMVLFVGLPANREENSVAAGKYVVRNITGLDPQQGILAVAEHVSEGEAMIFAFRDGQRARDDLNQMLQRQAEAMGERKPAFGFYFNCCARGCSLYGIPGIDSAYIRQALGEFPLIGMFGGYKLAPLAQTNHLFAYTGVLALITD